jgi:hypothetical protein
MEQGFQTTVDPAKASLYNGVETDRQTLPPTAARTTAGTSEGLAADQATQLTDALRMAYCQPGVAAFFNFEIADEPGLGGWQSGLLWTDFTPKPSYQPFRDAVRTVTSRQVSCNRFTQLSAGAAAGAEIGFSPGPDKPGAPTKPTPPPKKKSPVITVK